MTALHYAVRSNNESVVRLLLFGSGSEKRVSLETKTSEGYTVLHLAALHNCKSIARLLIRAGADLSARTNEGDSAVHLASSKGITNNLILLHESYSSRLVGHIKLSTFLFDAMNSFNQNADTVLESKSIDSVERFIILFLCDMLKKALLTITEGHYPQMREARSTNDCHSSCRRSTLHSRSQRVGK